MLKLRTFAEAFRYTLLPESWALLPADILKLVFLNANLCDHVALPRVQSFREKH